jgi:hypothetical protein
VKASGNRELFSQTVRKSDIRGKRIWDNLAFSHYPGFQGDTMNAPSRPHHRLVSLTGPTNLQADT